MNLQRKGTRQSHRGVIGVESAIVMIAFVIVAAALAFVVLNMGFTTSQKAKTSIISSLNEASSSMQVAGKVTGSGAPASGVLNATAFPIKVTSGGAHINLDALTTAIKYVANDVSYDDIYVGTLEGEFKSLATAVSQAVTDVNVGNEQFSDIDSDPYTATGSGIPPTNTRAFIYFTQEIISDDILEQGEQAVLAVVYNMADRPAYLDQIKIEIITPTGASLTVERQVPAISNTVVDLG